MSIFVISLSISTKMRPLKLKMDKDNIVFCENIQNKIKKSENEIIPFTYVNYVS